MQTAKTPQALREEMASCVTHGAGAILAVAGLAVMAILASQRGNAWHIVACAVFGATMVLLYAASTIYHGVRCPRLKKKLLLLDHCAIYLLIAGSYTPFTLVTLRGALGWSLFGIVWSLALAGIAIRLSKLSDWETPRIILYLAMGWAVLIAIVPVVQTVPFGGLALVVAGGISYTVGVAFFLWRSLPYNHAVWHLFVMAGTALHYFAVLWYVIPPASGA